jgi:hypothetical protein
MSSVRVARRWIDAGARRSEEFERGSWIALAVCCAILFVLAFVLGRVLSPTSQAGQGGLPRIAVTPANTQLPVSLSTVPAIRRAVRIAPPPPVRRATRHPPVLAARPAVIAPVTPAPAVVTPPRPASASPAPVSAPEPSRRTPAPRKSSSGGGGVSFDSSG